MSGAGALGGLRARLAGRERPVADVPRGVLVLLGLALAAQLAWHGGRPPPSAEAADLPAPPSEAAARVAALGEPEVLARTLLLWLQAFDNQPGVSIPFAALDYDRVEAWLSLALALDPRGQYPLLAAARVYGEVSDEARKRQMLEFVHDRFFDDPARRWPWLAHASIMARHRLQDLPLALRYARAITEHALSAPAWARDMSAILLEDMGELEAARVLIGGLLASGRITDAHEIRFLERKLQALEQGVENSTGR